MRGIYNIVCRCLVVGGLCAFSSSAMDIEWTRMTGQFAPDAGPVVVDVDGDGSDEIVLVNVGGQVLLWASDGTAIGEGQDGMVVQLPEGEWPSMPGVLDTDSGPQLVFGNVHGQLVAFDNTFRQVWTYALPGETTWSRAVPVPVDTPAGTAWCIADQSGTVTCLNTDGTARWAAALDEGPCRTILQTLELDNGDQAILAPVGTTLCCLETDGDVLWRRDLGGEMLARPEVLTIAGQRLIVEATGSGSVVAVNTAGEIVWETPIGTQTDATLVFLPRDDGDPLIICAGLWGNLYALDATGQLVWTHVFRAKVRARPAVWDVDGDGAPEIVVPTYHQHLLAFDGTGRIVDDVRLNGGVNGWPALMPAADNKRMDLLVGTSFLLAQRFHPGPARSPYGPCGEPAGVTLSAAAADAVVEAPGVVIDNPNGAFLRVNVTMTGDDGRTFVKGTCSALSRFEITYPDDVARGGAWSVRAEALDSTGDVIADGAWVIPSRPDTTPRRPASGTLTAWATPAYASFADTRMGPYTNEMPAGSSTGVEIEGLYVGEADQAAFAVTSTFGKPVRVLVSAPAPKSADENAFGGAITLRQVVVTGTVNGEKVADALPALGDAGLITIPAHQSVKVWVAVDARGAAPGTYTGSLVVHPLYRETADLDVPLSIEVLDLALPDELPQTVCTWDYLPNGWFSNRVPEILDDMGRHGINVWPRSGMPRARVDAAGQMTFDWTPLDTQLDLLDGRGYLLIHTVRPPIAFEVQPDEAAKHRYEIAFLHALRDHLKQRGWDYDHYAFYPVDEPGLDHGRRVPMFLEAAQLFREADPNFLIYTDPVAGLSWTDFERIEPYVDVWCTNMSMATGLLTGDPRVERIANSGGVLWSYQCLSQVRSLSPLVYNRGNAWRADYFGFTGIGFWTYSTTKHYQWQPGETYQEEYCLVYPGQMPVPSVRYEAVRDGLEDIAAMHLLEERIAEHETAGTKAETVAEARETLRIARTDAMELSDEAYVESRDFLAEGDRRIGHTWTGVETFRRHRAKIAELTRQLGAETTE